MLFDFMLNNPFPAGTFAWDTDGTLMGMFLPLGLWFIVFIVTFFVVVHYGMKLSKFLFGELATNAAASILLFITGITAIMGVLRGEKTTND